MHAQDPVNRLMTEAVLPIDVSAPLSEALRLFAEYPVHHLPVVRGATLVGMLSSADVMKLEGFLPKNGKASRDYLDQRFRIDMLMRHPAISVLPHQSAEDAARRTRTALRRHCSICTKGSHCSNSCSNCCVVISPRGRMRPCMR